MNGNVISTPQLKKGDRVIVRFVGKDKAINAVANSANVVTPDGARCSYSLNHFDMLALIQRS